MIMEFKLQINKKLYKIKIKKNNSTNILKKNNLISTENENSLNYFYGFQTNIMLGEASLRLFIFNPITSF
jgi:hypothetical protein